MHCIGGAAPAAVAGGCAAGAPPSRRRRAHPLPGPAPAPVPRPRREDFFAKVGMAPGDEAAMAQMHGFCQAFGALLGEVQAFLAANGLDDPAKV